jgi:hypothetical protein
MAAAPVHCKSHLQNQSTMALYHPLHRRAETAAPKPCAAELRGMRWRLCRRPPKTNAQSITAPPQHLLPCLTPLQIEAPPWARAHRATQQPRRRSLAPHHGLSSRASVVIAAAVEPSTPNPASSCRAHPCPDAMLLPDAASPIRAVPSPVCIAIFLSML